MLGRLLAFSILVKLFSELGRAARRKAACRISGEGDVELGKQRGRIDERLVANLGARPTRPHRTVRLTTDPPHSPLSQVLITESDDDSRASSPCPRSVTDPTTLPDT